jgi:hypothetical protein
MLMAKKRIYISGPISGYEIWERKQTFRAVRQTMEAKGYEVVNPMEKDLADDAPYTQHMRMDIPLLATCDVIYFLDGWRRSSGCLDELINAAVFGIKFQFENPEDYA